MAKKEEPLLMDRQLAQDLLNYLSGLPFKDVWVLIQKIQQLGPMPDPVKEQKLTEELAKGKKKSK